MKIVDENGKLFKKVNLVDAIVALLLVIVILAVGYRAVSAGIAAKHERDAASAANAYENAPHLKYQVVCPDIPREVAEAFEEQMELPLADRQLMSMGKALEGYITECTIAPTDEEDESAPYTVYFTIEAVPAEDEGIYSVGSQEVRVGKAHIVKTYLIETTGWVYSMEEPANA